MRQNVTRVDDNRRIVVGKVKAVQKNGNVINVTITSGVWNKDTMTEDQNDLTIAFWNNDKVKMADRVEKAGVAVDSIIAAQIYEKDGKIYGDQFGYSVHWTIKDPEGEKPDRNFFLGRVSRIRSDEQVIRFGLQGIRNVEGWENPTINVWKREGDNLYDRAMKVIKEDTLVSLVTAQWDPRAFVDKEGNERVSDNYRCFSFDIVDWPRKKAEEAPAEA
jgi:hypothetical protein